MRLRNYARYAPLLFVLLWSSGFVVARLVRPYAEPFSFITLRFALSTIVLFLIARAGAARFPRDRSSWINALIAGALMQGAYVGSVFWAVRHGLPAAIAALISGLQPLLTAMFAAPLLGEKVGLMRWAGIATGFAGALLVIAPNLTGAQAVPLLAVGACLIGMVSITFGTIWQKRTGGRGDLRAGATIQFLGGLIVVGPLMLATETAQIAMVPQVWFGLIWSVLVLSIITVLLLLFLIKNGEVAGVASLFYLVPPVTALMACILFGDALAPIQFVGMALAAVGVALANRR